MARCGAPIKGLVLTKAAEHTTGAPLPLHESSLPKFRVVPTAIVRVTVYKNGALVVRSGEGDGAVEVQGLPLLFASETLRVSPRTGTVSAPDETVALKTHPAPAPLADTMKTLHHDIAAVTDAVHSVQVQIDHLQGLHAVAPDSRHAGALVDAERYVNVWQFSAARRTQLQAEHDALTTRLRALVQAQRRAAEHPVTDRRPPIVQRACRFTLSAACAFELEYFIAAAVWVPSYTLTLSGSGERQHAKLVCAALVAQATGESWDNVALSVSTADLSRSTALPTLSSWRMGRAQADVAKAWRALPSDLPQLFFGYDRGARHSAPDREPAPPPPPPPAAPEHLMDDNDDGVALGAMRPNDASGSFGAGADFESLKSDELRSFERQGTPRLARTMAKPRPDSSVEGADEVLRAPAPTMLMAPSAPKGAAGTSLRLRKEHVLAEPEPLAVHAALPQRWRTAYLRMAGPDEAQRGTLLPLDPIARLGWLLDAHDADDDARAELGRAIDALKRAAQQLTHAPLPQGTQALADAPGRALARLTARERTDVACDGSFYRVVVRTDDVTAALEHHVVPRLSNDAWRLCKLDIRGAPLPAGPLAVYENGAFVVTAQLTAVGGGSSVDVNLGVDPDVRVVGRTVKTQQLEKGLVSQTSAVEHRVTIEVRSSKTTPTTLVLHDRVPVPADNIKDVAVQLLDGSPPPTRTNTDPVGAVMPGGLLWRTTLMPNTTFVVEHNYAITLPAKSELVGGNRRE